MYDNKYINKLLVINIDNKDCIARRNIFIIIKGYAKFHLNVAELHFKIFTTHSKINKVEYLLYTLKIDEIKFLLSSLKKYINKYNL